MAQGPSIGAGIKAFLSYCRVEKGLAANSIDAYQRDLERLDAYLATRSGTAGLTIEDLRTYLDFLMDTGLSSRSIARHLATLRNFFRFLVREDKLRDDPTAMLVAPRPWKSFPKYLSGQEVDDVLEAPDVARPLGMRDRAMVELLYATGLRVSELCQVEVNDLDPSLGVIRVVGKGNKQRIVPVGDAAVAAVDLYIDSVDRHYLKEGRAAICLSPPGVENSPGRASGNR